MMSGSSSEVVAPASTELTTPANSTPNASTAITTAASHVVREARVPRRDEHHARDREGGLALQAVADRAAEVDEQQHREGPEARRTWPAPGCRAPGPPSANAAGMSTAARVARRSAEKPRSWARSHSQPGSSRGMAIGRGQGGQDGSPGWTDGLADYRRSGFRPWGPSRSAIARARAGAMAVGGRHREHVARRGSDAVPQGRQRPARRVARPAARRSAPFPRPPPRRPARAARGQPLRRPVAGARASVQRTVAGWLTRADTGAPGARDAAVAVRGGERRHRRAVRTRPVAAARSAAARCR